MSPDQFLIRSSNSPRTQNRSQFTTEEQAEIDRFLAEYGSDIKGVNKYGKTLLHDAISDRGMNFSDRTKFETDAIIKYLVSQGADVNAKDSSGFTPLSEAASSKKSGNIEIAKFLVSKGADVNAGDMPPIHLAVMTGYMEMTKALVSLGANVHRKINEKGATIIDAARGLGNTAMVQYLSSLPATPNLPQNPPTMPKPFSLPPQAPQSGAMNIWTTLTTKSETLTQSKQKARILWGISWGWFALILLVVTFSFEKIVDGTAGDDIGFILSIVIPTLPMIFFFYWAFCESSRQITICPKCERLDACRFIRKETLQKTKKVERREREASRIHHSGNRPDTVIYEKYDVPVTEHTVRNYYQCAFCQHTWTDITSHTTDG